MAGAKKGTWIGGTAIIAVAITAGAWFLAIEPRQSAAAELRDQTVQVETSNEVLSAQIQKLAKEFAELPQRQAELEQLRAQIPTTAQLSSYLRQVNDIATAHALAITTITPGTPVSFVPAASTQPTPTPEPTESTEETPEEPTDGEDPQEPGTEPSPAAEDPASLVPDGFVAIPLSVTVLGTYDNTLAFLSDIQTVTPRLFLVAGLTGTAQKEQEASGGKPATHAGDQELVVSGYLYVLKDPLASAAPAPDPSATPTAPALPGAVPGKNPLVPIAGE